MGKISFENQGMNQFLVYQLEDEDVLDSMTLGMLVNNQIPGLAGAAFFQLDDQKTVKYNITSRITAADLFKNKVNRKRFFGYLNGIIDALMAVDDYMLNPNAILLDDNYIFVNPGSGNTVLICSVVENEQEPTDLKEFLKKEIMQLQFDTMENSSYVTKILNYLNENQNLELKNFRKYLAELIQAKPSQPKVPQTPTASVSVENNVEPPAVGGTPVLNWEGGMPQMDIPGLPHIPSASKKKEPTGKDEKDISLFYLLQHYNKDNAAAYKMQKNAKKADKEAAKAEKNAAKKNKKDSKKEKKETNQAAVNYSVPGMEAHGVKEPAFASPAHSDISVSRGGQKAGLMQNEQSRLFEQMASTEGNYGETVLLVQPEEFRTVLLTEEPPVSQLPKAFLVRVSKGEKIEIDKPSFQIGTRKETSDYCVNDNQAVSRAHVQINFKDDSFTIKDLGSTNHTYVNGEMIAAESELPLPMECELRLGNEEFLFKQET